MPRIYRHLSLAERDRIMRLRDARVPVSKIAAELGRHPATIYRELRRNFFFDDDAYFRGYFGRVAHSKAAARRLRGGKIVRNPDLAFRIAQHLHQCWSPEQIAGRLRLDEADPIAVCHETIYQYVYGSEGRRLGQWSQLPRQRKSRRRRYARKPRGLNIPLANTIAERPKVITDRNQFGHWEGDLIAFTKEFGKANLTSLVERRSRFVVLTRNPSRHSSGVMQGIERHLHPLPHNLPRRFSDPAGLPFRARISDRLRHTVYCHVGCLHPRGPFADSHGAW